MMFWFAIDPSIMIDDRTIHASGALSPAEKSYFKIYAEAESIGALLYFDLGYFYEVDHGRKISMENFMLHYFVNWALVLSYPTLPLMLTWLSWSTLGITIFYVIVTIDKGMQGETTNSLT